MVRRPRPRRRERGLRILPDYCLTNGSHDTSRALLAHDTEVTVEEANRGGTDVGVQSRAIDTRRIDARIRQLQLAVRAAFVDENLVPDRPFSTASSTSLM